MGPLTSRKDPSPSQESYSFIDIILYSYLLSPHCNCSTVLLQGVTIGGIVDIKPSVDTCFHRNTLKTLGSSSDLGPPRVLTPPGKTLPSGWVRNHRLSD